MVVQPAAAAEEEPNQHSGETTMCENDKEQELRFPCIIIMSP